MLIKVGEICICLEKKFLGSLCRFTDSIKPNSGKEKEKEKLIYK